MIYSKYGSSGEEQLYFRSMGKIFRVTCIADSDEEANEHCRKHKDEGVIGLLQGSRPVVAEFYGEKITSKR